MGWKKPVSLDINGDGFDDIIIGDPFFGDGGVTHIIWGKNTSY